MIIGSRRADEITCVFQFEEYSISAIQICIDSVFHFIVFDLYKAFRIILRLNGDGFSKGNLYYRILHTRPPGHVVKVIRGRVLGRPREGPGSNPGCATVSGEDL